MPENLYPTISDLEINIEGVVSIVKYTIDPLKRKDQMVLLKELSHELAPCLTLSF